MKAKWYFGVLVIILTFLGTSQDSVVVPNQQIVLQFVNETVAVETEHTIATVKQQLQTIGVTNVKVVQQTDGLLKFSYYSDVNIDVIKTVLSKDKVLKLALTDQDTGKGKKELPSKQSINTYNLNVYEIQNDVDADSGLGGICVFESNKEFDQTYSPKVYSSFVATNQNENNNFCNLAYRCYNYITLVIDNDSYKIPEVRAGPSLNKNA